MKQLSRRAAIQILAAGGGLLGLGLAGGYALRDLGRSAHGPVPAGSDPGSPGMPPPMMGNATAADMSTYMNLFSRYEPVQPAHRAPPDRGADPGRCPYHHRVG